MGAGIAAAVALRPRPAVTVVLTDGYTPWPERAPKGIRVVVGLLGADAPAGREWARAVRSELDGGYGPGGDEQAGPGPGAGGERDRARLRLGRGGRGRL